MKLKKLKAISNGSRHQLNLCKNLLSKQNRFLKKDLLKYKSKAGRSLTTGQITTRHKGAGCKKVLRKLNSTNFFSYSIVLSTFYDPIRSSFISCNYNFISCVLELKSLTHSVFPGSFLSCDKYNTDLKLGFRTILKNIPTGSIINNISLAFKDQSKYIKAAGTFGQLIQKDFKKCKVKLPSGQILTTSTLSYATIGLVSNLLNNQRVIGKAGKNRLLGIRPTVRGIAMNPVDHPHGGRTNGGMPSVTPWGKPTRGKPTVLNKKK